MNNFGPKRSSNPGFQRRGMAQGNPSGLVAVLILGAAVYFHLGQSGKFEALLGKYFSADKGAVEQKVEGDKATAPVQKVVPAKPVKPVEPTIVEVIRNTRAYDSTENGNLIGTVEAGTSLRILDIKRNNQGTPMYIQIRANGMKLWIKAQGTKLKVEG